MAEELSFNNISELPPGFDLFDDDDAQESAGNGGQPSQEEGREKETEQKQQRTAEVEIDPMHIFDDDDESEEEEQQGGKKKPESVGGGKKQGEETPPAPEGAGDNSSADFYSSVAGYLRDRGVFSDLDDEAVSQIVDDDTFIEAINKEVQSRYDEGQRELMEALGYGADVKQLNAIKEDIKFLDSVNPEALENDSDANMVDLRKSLIMGYYMSLGMDEKQARRELDKSLNAHTDIDDAKAALEQQKQYLRDAYNGIVESAKAKEQEKQAQIEKRKQEMTERLQKNDEPIKGLKVDKRVRERALDNMYTPAVKGEDGKYYTKMQYYQMTHPEEFMLAMGLVYTLTDGMTNFEKLVSSAVRKERNNNVKSLESVLRNQQGGGKSLRYVSNGREEADNGRQSRYTIVT